MLAQITRFPQNTTLAVPMLRRAGAMQWRMQYGCEKGAATPQVVRQARAGICPVMGLRDNKFVDLHPHSAQRRPILQMVTGATAFGYSKGSQSRLCVLMRRMSIATTAGSNPAGLAVGIPINSHSLRTASGLKVRSVDAWCLGVCSEAPVQLVTATGAQKESKRCYTRRG